MWSVIRSGEIAYFRKYRSLFLSDCSFHPIEVEGSKVDGDFAILFLENAKSR